MNAKTNATRVSKIRATKLRTDFPVGVPSKEDGLIHRSGRAGVVAKVHDLCQRIVIAKGGTRKDVLARAAKLGIAEHTARTQYQRFMSGRKNRAAKRASKRAA